MLRCANCKQLVSEDDLIIVRDDPSPAGIALPKGAYEYAYCPYCGDDDLDEFNLTDAIDISEGDDEVTTIIEFEGKKLKLYLSEDGTFCWSAA